MTLNFSRYQKHFFIYLILISIQTLALFAHASPSQDVNKKQLENTKVDSKENYSEKNFYDSDSLSVPQNSEQMNENSNQDLILPSRTPLTKQYRSGIWLNTDQAVLHFSRQLPMNDEDSFEYAFIFSSQNKAGGDIVYKKYCCEGKWSELFWSVGIYQMSPISEFLAGWLKSEGYAFHVGIGAEDLLYMNRKLQGQFFISQSNITTQFFLGLSYAFGEE